MSKRSAVMDSVVACRTKRNQILLCIVTGLTAKVFVMDFEVGPCATRLTSPAIPTQHLIAQVFIQLGIEPQACAFRLDTRQDPFSVTRCRNVCLSWPGRNLKNRSADCKRTSGSSLSRFAPARKSAQIISRQ